jgi:RimJ/RimL family protein N-acetyltransferase
LLIGPREQIGKGYSESIVRCLIHYIFACTAAEKVVGEPDSRVKAFLKLAEYIGYENQGLIEFPEKTAVLFYCYREKFYSLNQT